MPRQASVSRLASDLSAKAGILVPVAAATLSHSGFLVGLPSACGLSAEHVGGFRLWGQWSKACTGWWRGVVNEGQIRRGPGQT